MSLLIKALDKAQAEKAQSKNANDEVSKRKGERRPKVLKAEENPALVKETLVELSLSPPEASIAEETGFDIDKIPAAVVDSAAVAVQKEAVLKSLDKTTEKPSSVVLPSLSQTGNAYIQTSSNSGKPSPSPKQAANVFAAKRIEATHQNTKLFVIVGAGLIALLAMAAYFYQYLDDSPVVILPSRPPLAQPSPIASSQAASTPANAPQVAAAEPVPTIQSLPETTRVFEQREPVKLAEKQKSEATPMPENSGEEMSDAPSTLASNQVIVRTSKKENKSNLAKAVKGIASDSASIQVTQSQPQPSVNPTLLSAYEAYNAGNDNEAQKLYKQVLQRDISNVDALLGLGAIATRQGRAADANGWYRKVLEIEPRNATAQAAVLAAQQHEDPQTGESHIKSLLAQLPNDANLYVALGNLYAEQNQWVAAQQAYFDAFRLNSSAENAFNLAISLDQMGKPKLALPYYQHALQLTQTGTTNIDVAALEARIAAIQ